MDHDSRRPWGLNRRGWMITTAATGALLLGGAAEHRALIAAEYRQAAREGRLVKDDE